MKITNQAYKAKYKTKYNFGGLLPAGIKVNIVKEFEGNNVAVIDHQKNIWHGSTNRQFIKHNKRIFNIQ